MLTVRDVTSKPNTKELALLVVRETALQVRAAGECLVHKAQYIDLLEEGGMRDVSKEGESPLNGPHSLELADLQHHAAP